MTKDNIIFRQKLKEYYVSVDMAKELCMVEGTAKGQEARRWFIDREKLLTTIEKGTPAISVDPITALFEAGKLAHERQLAMQKKQRQIERKVETVAARVEELQKPADYIPRRVMPPG